MSHSSSSSSSLIITPREHGEVNNMIDEIIIQGPSNSVGSQERLEFYERNWELLCERMKKLKGEVNEITKERDMYKDNFEHSQSILEKLKEQHSVMCMEYEQMLEKIEETREKQKQTVTELNRLRVMEKRFGKTESIILETHDNENNDVQPIKSPIVINPVVVPDNKEEESHIDSFRLASKQFAETLLELEKPIETATEENVVKKLRFFGKNKGDWTKRRTIKTPGKIVSMFSTLKNTFILTFNEGKWKIDFLPCDKKEVRPFVSNLTSPLFIVAGNALVYYTNNKLFYYAIQTQETTPIEVNSQITNLFRRNGVVYAVDDHNKVYTVNSDGLIYVQKLRSKADGTISISQNNVMYLKEGKFYLYNMFTNKELSCSLVNMVDFIVVGTNIWIAHAKRGIEIVSMDLKQSQSVITNYSVLVMKKMGGYVFVGGKNIVEIFRTNGELIGSVPTGVDVNGFAFCKGKKKTLDVLVSSPAEIEVFKIKLLCHCLEKCKSGICFVCGNSNCEVECKKCKQSFHQECVGLGCNSFSPCPNSFE